MAWYMSVDGEAWEQAPDLKRDILDVLPWYRKEYGAQRFGYVELPTKEVIDAIWDVDEDLRNEFDTVNEWIKWYLESGGGGVPDHASSNRWPVILSGDAFEGEVLQDGWHRLSDYIRKGARVIPALYYPNR